MRLAFLFPALAALAACQTTPIPPVHEQERFQTESAYSRLFPASPAATCDAARRALLSQGYLTVSRTGAVEGRKKFQYDAANHLEIEFHVVCARNNVGGGSVAFVSALQDRYALKKSPTNASVGVGAFGTVSLPIGASDDALVKVASETIAAEDFYTRFFGLLEHHLVKDEETTP
jgi:hypothetical protein